jgi:hypothetical protein
MEISWYPAESGIDEIKDVLKTEGAEVRNRMGFDPLSTITVVAAGAVLVRALMRLYKDARYKGVIIDITRKPVEVREMSGWPRQQVLLVSAEGARFIEVGDTVSGFENLNQLTKLLDKVK